MRSRGRCAGRASGVSIAVKEKCPSAKIYSVEPAGFDDLARSLESGERERNAELSGSICDALMANTPGKLTFEVAKRNLAGGLAVTDEEAKAAVRYAFEELKLVLEPGGAVSLAAILAGQLPPIGFAADRAGDHRRFLIALSWAGLAALVALAQSRGFWPILLCTLFFALAWTTI